MFFLYSDSCLDCSVLLRTTETTGACFIRTDQLDGETDWKLRLAVASSQRKESDEMLLESQVGCPRSRKFESNCQPFVLELCHEIDSLDLPCLRVRFTLRNLKKIFTVSSESIRILMGRSL